MHDVLIIGGGVIGLSLAWDLARRGRRVRVVDRGQPGREASWAGAGILHAVSRAAAVHPLDQLYGLACELHPRWAAELRELTGVDTGYRRCGGIYLARTPGEAAALAAWAADQRGQGVEVERLSADDLSALEPALVLGTQYPVLGKPPAAPAAFRVPADAQLRNPRHLKALVAACEHAQVEITADCAAAEAVVRSGRVEQIDSPAGPLRARQYCFTAGAWTGQMLSRLGIRVSVMPIRGQMVLFRARNAPEGERTATEGVPYSGPPIAHIINEGSRYLVPREDGRVLAGSTEEEVGFDKRTTEEGLAELTAFARSLVPALAEAQIERTWAGLRPGSFDGLPYLGKLPGLANAFVAAGHFRSGLYLSPATAVVMSELLRGENPQIDLAPFRVGR